MKFTHYYSNLIRANGVPHLGVKQYQYIFNLIVLESRISEINQLTFKISNADSKAVLSHKVYRLYDQSNNLTKGNELEMIMTELLTIE